jgi:Trp operon repressor
MTGHDNSLMPWNKDSIKQSILTGSIISEETRKVAAAIKLLIFLLQISISNRTISESLSPSAAKTNKSEQVTSSYNTTNHFLVGVLSASIP